MLITPGALTFARDFHGVVIVLLAFVHTAVEPGGCDHQADQDHRNDEERQIQQIDVDLLTRAGAVLDLGVRRQVVDFPEYEVLADVDQPTVDGAILVDIDGFECFWIYDVLLRRGFIRPLELM